MDRHKAVLRGEIYLVKLTGCEGSEQSGTRPCLIVQNDIGNKFSPTTIISPITTQKKRFDATHIEVECLRELSTVMFEQIRAVDKCRIKKFICKLSDEKMKEADDKLRLTLGL